MPGVAPSRVRGLKLMLSVYPIAGLGRTLTGAWIETKGVKHTWICRASHPHGCVD